VLRQRLQPGTSARLAATLFATIFVAGCGSLSASAKSVSQLVSIPIKSSYESSSPEAAYRTDVADYTAAYLESGGDPSKLMYEISSVAEKRGITDWEHDSTTYQGLGAGLKRAGLSQAELDTCKRTLTETEAEAGWMQQGYDSASND